MSEPFLGEIRMFGFNFAPAGWAMCNGQLLPINQNQALFSLLGTFYGGNGTSTFALPDLRSRVAVHMGMGPGLTGYVIGEVTGEENHRLVQSEMPAHTHKVNCDGSSTAHGASSPNVFGVSAGGTPVNHLPGRVASPGNEVYSSAAPAGSTMNPNMIAVAGSSLPHNNLQPLLVVNFCIALEGIFPARN